ncbi:MAG TPA: anti-sigma factor [Burkholderiales bacterium]
MSSLSNEEQLHAYVDDALAPAERAQVEMRLRAEPEAARRVEAYRRLNLLLRAALDPLLEEPVPERLQRVPTLRERRPSWLRHAAFAASLLLAGAAGWFLRGAADPRPAFGDALAVQAAAAYRVYTPEVLHPVEVGAQQEEHLVGWLSKRLGAPLRAPYLGDAGYRLVGGRLLPAEERAAAQLMYEDVRGRRLTLYVAGSPEQARETSFRYAEQNGVSTFYWIEGGFGYALSGELGREELLEVAEAVYRDIAMWPQKPHSE